MYDEELEDAASILKRIAFTARQNPQMIILLANWLEETCGEEPIRQIYRPERLPEREREALELLERVVCSRHYYKPRETIRDHLPTIHHLLLQGLLCTDELRNLIETALNHRRPVF